MNAAQAITRTLRRREQYRLVADLFRAVLVIGEVAAVAGAIYLLTVLALSF